ncbi:hypothetical protein [Butyrivibrio sp. WCD3002]|uniref:hypothetical protein n=1 Tax=Butyrivibrio sp. WCD3002 TaxID=1280676 RepID=UPI000404A8A3|nr:hypothetical protein [Butyrivibrio sp. WCD3002]
MTIGAQILDVIFKNPGITAPEITALFDKNSHHIYNELYNLELTHKVTVDRNYTPQRYYPIGVSTDNIGTKEIKEVSEYVSEFDEIIREVTRAAGKPIESGYEIIDRGMPHTPKSLGKGKMGIYTFNYNGEFLKIGEAGPSSNARFESQHYLPKSSNSNLSKSILKDSEMQGLGINELNVGDWIKKNTRRIDILLDASLGIFALNLLEAALHYKYEPRYEGFKNQR